MAQAHRSQDKPKGWYGHFKAAVKALKHECTAIYYAIQDPRCPWYARVIPFLVLGYALSPLDLIPDFIPVLGLVDDLLLLPLLLWVALKVVPTEVLKDARTRAAAEPIRLACNWACAVAVFCLWAAFLLWVVYYCCDRYGDDRLKPWIIHITSGTGVVLTVIFAWWLRGAVHKDKMKRAKAAAAAAAAREHQAEEGLTQPLLDGADATEDNAAEVEAHSQEQQQDSHANDKQPSEEQQQQESPV